MTNPIVSRRTIGSAHPAEISSNAQGGPARQAKLLSVNLTQSGRFVLRPPAVALLLAGFGLIALAVVYFVTPAHQLPSLLPGHDATSRHHIKHGLAMLMLAAGAWVGAWFVSAPPSN